MITGDGVEFQFVLHPAGQQGVFSNTFFNTHFASCKPTVEMEQALCVCVCWNLGRYTVLPFKDSNRALEDNPFLLEILHQRSLHISKMM